MLCKQEVASKVSKTPLFEDTSIKSDYYICIDELIDTNPFKVSSSWNLVWKLQVSPKIKNHVWKILF
jgi:hypothetical protein